MNVSKGKIAIIAAAAVGLLLIILPDGQRWRFTLEPAKVGGKILANAGFIPAAEVEAKLRVGDKDFKVLDLRNESSRRKGTIRGSEHVPLMMLMSKYYVPRNLDKKTTYALMCSDGTQSIQTWMVLQSAGYKAFAIQGGFEGWLAAVKDINLYENISADELKARAGSGGTAEHAPAHRAKKKIKAKAAPAEEEGC